MKPAAATPTERSASPRRHRARAAALTTACLTLFAGCRERTSPTPPDGTVDAVVTVAPLAGLVRPLLPEKSTLKVLMVPGRSEHGYEFSPSDFDALARADLAVYVGLGLEPPVARFLSNRTDPNRHEVRLGAALGLEPASTPRGSDEHDGHDGHDGHESHDDHAGHDHEKDHDSHGPIDPHVWLDPILVLQSLPAIRDAVRDAMKSAGVSDEASLAHAAKAFDELEARVKEVDAHYREALAPFQGSAIITHHAAFGRLAQRYGLRIAAVIRPVESSEPTPGDLDAVRTAIHAEKAHAIFVEPQFSTGAAERLAKQAGVRLLVLDPIGEGDWTALMEKNLSTLVDGLSNTPQTTPPR